MATQTVVRQRTSITGIQHKTTAPPQPTLIIHGRPIVRVPTATPPFTLADIRRAIPPHCFTHSLITSFAYLFFDILLIIAIATAANQIQQMPTILQPILWIVYWVAQGSVMTGVWVLGHECGHGGFAANPLINDVVGWILHSALLVPYFSWQMSHRKHHSNTGNIARDEVFVPKISKVADDSEDDSELTIVYTAESLVRVFRITMMLTLGWPLYLFFNMTGNKSYTPSFTLNHFTPSSQIFADIRSAPKLVIISDIGVVLTIAALTYLSYTFSFITVATYYLIPYMVTNLFLVLITFLQHTDHVLPHYTATEWDWLRGALATVDRDYGILNHVMHHISDTHVVHHLFSSMPHYHALEATEAVKPLLGDYYRYDSTPVPLALWRSYGECNYIKADETNKGVMWYKY